METSAGLDMEATIVNHEDPEVVNRLFTGVDLRRRPVDLPPVAGSVRHFGILGGTPHLLVKSPNASRSGN